MKALTLLFAAALLGACRDGSVSMTFVATDTVRATLSATTMRCPSGKGWLLEGVDSVLAVLIWLPSDSPATWVPRSSGPGDRPRVVVQRLARASIDTWLADSGLVTLRNAALGQAGDFSVVAGSHRASGSFRAPRPSPDTLACVAPLSIGPLDSVP